MTLHDILLHKNLDLPLVNNDDKINFKDFLKEKLLGYKSIISLLPDKFMIEGNKPVHTHLLKSNTSKLIDGILKTVEHYYDGKPNLAYNELVETLTFDNSTILEHLPIGKLPEKLYRARVVETNFNLFKEDLFHIPFELRNLVSTQRYSIPGFPSLYLSNSVYVAWEELKRPNIDTMQVSQFTPTEDLRIIYLRNTEFYRYKYSYIDIDNPKVPDQELLNFIFTWPLTAACNIKARHNLKPFIPEYIIPQLLLQFIRNTDAHKGIAYSSTNVLIHKDNSKNIFLNFVIPIFQDGKTGHCTNLTRQFHLTNPISNQLIKATKEGDDNSYTGTGDRELINKDIEFIELVKRKKTFYNYSTFGGIEKYLTYNLKAESIYKTD